MRPNDCECYSSRCVLSAFVLGGIVGIKSIDWQGVLGHASKKFSF